MVSEPADVTTIEIKILSRGGKTAQAPQYKTSGAAAADLSAFLEADAVIPPGQIRMIPTGICIAVPQGLAALVLARSGLALKQGICLANGVGLIDSDYRGEIQVGLLNTSIETFVVRDGDRIAQLMLTPAPMAVFCVKEELSETERGSGGFGSTGVSLTPKEGT